MENVAEWIAPRRKKIAIGLGLGTAILVLLILFFRVDAFTMTRLHLPSDNASVSVDGDTLRAYNGAYFYKKSLAKEAPPTVLGGGVKLPEITQALWAGDSGVLLNFDQSLAGTAVQDIATKKGLPYTSTTASTWYFDFSTDSLQHVGSYLLHDRARYFDKEKKMLYYLEGDDGQVLHAFSTTTKRDRVIPLSVNFSAITQLGTCYDSSLLCVVGRPIAKPSHTEIYSVKDDGTAKKKISLDGDLYLVPGTAYGIALMNEDVEAGKGDGMIIEYAKGALLNLKTGEKLTINKRFSPGILYTTYGEDGDKLVFVGNLNEEYTTVQRHFLRPSVQYGRLVYSNGEKFGSSAIIIDSPPLKGSILLKTTDEEYSIFAPKGQVKADFSVHASDAVVDHVEGCTDGVDGARVRSDEESPSKIMLLLPDNSSLRAAIARVTDCIAKEADMMYGYTVAFSSYDTKNGKITSY